MSRLGPILLGALAGLAISAGAAMAADTLTVPMFKATPDGTGPSVGTITISSSAEGTQFKLDLRGLPPGVHGFHVHQNGSCLPTVTNGVRIPAGAAGGHWDPDTSGKHAGPHGEGHKGDLPLIQVTNSGTADQTLTAPRLKNMYELRGKALMIHVGGDNYSDDPQPLGGGGLRLACGVIPQ